LQCDVYEEAIDLDLIVSLTAGMSGADLEKVHRETVLQALSKNTDKICQSTLVEEINILKYGAKRSLDKCEKMLAETAFHEAGHAVVSTVLMPERSIEQISIVPREQALGMVAYSREQEVDHTKAFWFSQTCVALAGRAAQVKQFGDEGLDTGASSDLKLAMWSAWNPIARYGMHPDSYNLDATVIHEWSGEINSQGRKLFDKALQMLSINDEIFNEMSNATLRGRMRLGIPSEFASALLPSIVGEFSNRYPDVSLDVTSALTKHLISNNNLQQYDLVLALLQPSSTPTNIKLEQLEVIREDELVWVAQTSKPVLSQTLSLVLAPDGCVYRSRVIEKLKQQTQPWRITYTNPDFYGLLAAMKQGLGITVLAKSTVPDELAIVRDKRLPKLGKISIAILNLDTQHPQVSNTMAQFIKMRLKSS